MKSFLFILILCCGCSSVNKPREERQTVESKLNKVQIINAIMMANGVRNPSFRNVGEEFNATFEGVDGTAFYVEISVLDEWFPAEIFVSGDGTTTIRDAGTMKVIE